MRVLNPIRTHLGNGRYVVTLVATGKDVFIRKERFITKRYAGCWSIDHTQGDHTALRDCVNECLEYFLDNLERYKSE